MKTKHERTNGRHAKRTSRIISMRSKEKGVSSHSHRNLVDDKAAALAQEDR